VTTFAASFTISSTKECVIDGVGVLKPNEKRTLDKSHLTQFRAIHGYDIAKANFPNHVTFEAILGKEGNK